jgi:ParB family chromosome partitioning protein
MTPILIAPAAIFRNTLPRDRQALDPEALDELVRSIFLDGLRQPIEVMELEENDGPYTHGLLSGLRRLTAYDKLVADYPGPEKWAQIPCIVRQPPSLADALRLMVEENAVRADITPWDQARIAVDTVVSVPCPPPFWFWPDRLIGDQ